MHSDFKKFNNNSRNLVICFSGAWLAIDKIPIFEFSRLFSSVKVDADILLLRDPKNAWYLTGLGDSFKNFYSLYFFLKNEASRYDKVIAMGSSAGGYAAILFASLLNFYGCISFTPQTDLKIASEHNDWSLNKLKPILSTSVGKKYQNLNKYINHSSKYYIYCFDNDNKLHGIQHFDNLPNYPNIYRLNYNAKHMVKDNSLFELFLDLL
jgi:hypothetical protein